MIDLGRSYAHARPDRRPPARDRELPLLLQVGQRGRQRGHLARHRGPRGRAGLARAAAHGNHDVSRCRRLRRPPGRGASGDALRRLRRPAGAGVRSHRLGDEPGRAVLLRHVPRGRRRRRDPQGRARADSLRRRLHQGDDDGRPLGRARGPRSRPAHAGRGERARRGVAPHGLPRGGALRGHRRHRDRDRGGHRHDRARHVPEPAPRSAGADGARRPGAGSDGVVPLWHGRPRGAHRDEPR